METNGIRRVCTDESIDATDTPNRRCVPVGPKRPERIRSSPATLSFQTESIRCIAQTVRITRSSSPNARIGKRSPFRGKKTLSMKKRGKFTARENGMIALLMPMNACEKSCEISFNAQGTEAPIFEDGRDERIEQHSFHDSRGYRDDRCRNDIHHQREGGIRSIESAIVALLDKSAEMYAIGTNT
jgi:hypothetical protein